MADPSENLRSSIVVIELWSIPCTCQRCGEETLTKRCWPYYEEFLQPGCPGHEGGYVPVCGDCFCWLEDNTSLLWYREAA